MSLIFNETWNYEPGTIFGLLCASYAAILNRDLQDQFQEFDQEVFEHVDTVGACTFITTLGSETVGMASYDPRQAPERGIIGHNCILPEHQRKGYGRQQIVEVIRRLRTKGIRRAVVSTSEHPFFEPACKMYLSCGFAESQRKQEHPKVLYRRIYYRIELAYESHHKVWK